VGDALNAVCLELTAWRLLTDVLAKRLPHVHGLVDQQGGYVNVRSLANIAQANDSDQVVLLVPQQMSGCVGARANPRPSLKGRYLEAVQRRVVVLLCGAQAQIWTENKRAVQPVD